MGNFFRTSFALYYFIFFWLIIFYILGLYDLNLLQTSFSFYSRGFAGLGLSLVLGMLFFYLIPFFGITPKTNLVLNILIFGILIFAWRKFFYFLFSSYFLNKVAIIGENPQTKELIEEIILHPYLGYKLISINPNKNLLSQIQQENINTLILAENLELNSQLTQSLYQCLPAKINFLDFSQAYEIICGKIPISSYIFYNSNLVFRKPQRR